MAQTASTPIWDTIWPELIKGLPAALVALVIGAIAACIAYRQYRVARDKFRLDLFDRRYAIFLATWRELSRVVTDGPPQQAFSEFQNHVPQARFLFGPEIETYLQELMKNLTELRSIKLATDQNGNVVPHHLIQRQHDLVVWFAEEASSRAKDKFSPYLSFTKWSS